MFVLKAKKIVLEDAIMFLSRRPHCTCTKPYRDFLNCVNTQDAKLEIMIIMF